MKKIVIEKEQDDVMNKGAMPMIYTKEEIEEIYNDFFRGLCLELIPLKNEETVLKCMDLKSEDKNYKQDRIIAYLKVEEKEEKSYLYVDFITLFKPDTLKEYGILIPECEMLEDMLLPSPYLDSNIIIDKILYNLSKELGRVTYNRDGKTSGLEKFFQFLYDSEDIKIVGFEKVEGYEGEGDINILFSFPVVED